MKLEMSKTKRLLCLIALMMTNFGVMADLVIIPVISSIYQTYGGNMTAANYIVSGPSLIIVLTSLLAGVMCKKMDKKVVILIGGVLFAIGGICGILSTNVLYVCIMRTLVGCGAGILQVVAVAYIADVYDDPSERAKFTGYYNASLSLIGIAFGYFAGLLAQNDWTKVFNIYWVAVPMLVFLVLFVPSIRPAAAEETVKEKAAVKESFGGEFWRMEVFWFLSNILFGCTVLYYLSVYIAENALGDSVFSGTATSVKQFVGFVLCFAFGAIYTKLGRHTSTICYLLAGVTLIWMILAPSRFAAVAVGTVCGCMYKFLFSYSYAHGFSIVPASRRDDATAISTAVYGIGTFFSTYFITYVMKFMKTDSYTKAWWVPAIIFLAMALIELLCGLGKKKQ